MKNLLFVVFACCSISGYAQKQLQPTTAKDRLLGEEKRKQLEATSLVKSIQFKSVGPTVMSGRVVDIDVNPEKPIEFYAAYSSGGLWYTKNNGGSR